MLRLWAVAQRIGSVMTDQSAKIEIEVPPSDYTGPSIIFWTLHKAGSRYFYSVIKKLARSAGAPMLNIAAEYFQAGEKVELTPEGDPTKISVGRVLRRAAVFGARQLQSEDPSARTDERVVEVVVSADDTPFLIGQRVLVKFMKPGQKAGVARPVAAGVGPERT